MCTMGPVMDFSCRSASLPIAVHRLSQGGIPMKLIHQHPTYQTEDERMARLQELKKVCAAKLQNMRSPEKVA